MSSYRIVLVTSNINKKREVEIILSRYNCFTVDIAPHLRKVEIQSDSLEDIARTAIQHIAQVVKPQENTYIVVEDDGLFIDALRGFPGPYAEYIFRTIGLTGILKLMEGVQDRSATFKSVLGVYTPSGNITVIVGEVRGKIAESIRGTGGFGYDPIFIPEGYSKTFAEMTIEEKCRVSHRARAFSKLAEAIVSGTLR